MLRERIYLESSYAHQYDREKFGTRFGAMLEEQEINLYMELLGAAGGSVLDVGSGTGKLAVALLDKFDPVVAFDASAQMLDVATRKAKSKGYELQTVVGEAESLGFANETFDHVVSSRLLMHVDQWRKAIAELCRVARQGVIVDFPPLLGNGGMGALLRRLTKHWRPHVQAYKAYTIRMIAAEFHRNGFDVSQVRRGYCLPLALHRFVNRTSLSQFTEKVMSAIGLRYLMGSPVTIKAVRKERSQNHQEASK